MVSIDFSLPQMEKTVQSFWTKDNNNKTPLPTRSGKKNFYLQHSNSQLFFSLSIFFPPFRNRISKQKSTRKHSKHDDFDAEKTGKPLQSVFETADSLGPQEIRKALVIHVRESVFLREDTIIDSNTRLVGNKEGLGLMERLGRLDGTHDQTETNSGARRMTMDQLADEFTEQQNLLERLLNEFREQREVSERLLNESREQREVSEQHLKTLKKWWFLYRADQIEFAGTQLR